MASFQKFSFMWLTNSVVLQYLREYSLTHTGLLVALSTHQQQTLQSLTFCLLAHAQRQI